MSKAKSKQMPKPNQVEPQDTKEPVVKAQVEPQVENEPLEVEPHEMSKDELSMAERLAVLEKKLKEKDAQIEALVSMSEPEVVVDLGPKVKVVALREGFIYNRRIAPGEEFVIQHQGHLGSWMECEDSKLQKMHLANMRAKKEQRRKEAKEAAGK